jgi:ABC-type sugar transport system ATPase subunit
VIAVEWLGHERHVIVDVAGEKVTVRESSAGPAPAEGDEVRLRADPGEIHLFDPDTTERLT